MNYGAQCLIFWFHADVTQKKNTDFTQKILCEISAFDLCNICAKK